MGWGQEEEEFVLYPKQHIRKASTSSMDAKTIPPHLLGTCYVCLRTVPPGPAGFGVLPKEPRKVVCTTEGRRKHYIKQPLALNDLSPCCVVPMKLLVGFKHAP